MYIIAEIGSNHDGELNRAKQLIALAKECGADAAKFQSFQADTLISPLYKETWEILNRLSLPVEWHRELQDYAKSIGIDFLSTPFDLERLQLLLELDIKAIKIASGDLTYLELLEACAKSGKPIYLSTGHATLDEVSEAVKCFQEAGGEELILLHCASLYPAKVEDANLRAMVTLQERFNLPVGFSDHSPGSVASLGAVALGATVIEKHFTDDKSRNGPDHPFALNPEEFAALVRDIRLMEKAVGTGKKEPLAAESQERIMARRAVYAKQEIPKGTRITREMLRVVRHAYPEGIPANRLNETVGKITLREISQDALITPEEVGDA